MYTFLLSIVLLLLGYFVYGRLMERVFGADSSRQTPVSKQADGVDFVPLPPWRVFLIQLLNIAGLGPIFGAIMGVMYGQAAFLWIVFGSIFAGAVHDYMSGMMSLRSGGFSLPELVGDQLGTFTRHFLRLFSVLLMVLVGAVFISGPASLLTNLVPSISPAWWAMVVFIYYMLATLLPIDKLIGRLYPLFGIALITMAVGVMVAMLLHADQMPELTFPLQNAHPGGLPIFPMMFVSIACGAISGFHATQSPLMSRCITNERYGRPIFYGAMIAEGIIALIWAAAAITFWGSVSDFQAYMATLPVTANKAAVVVDYISTHWLGSLGGIFVMIGVVVAPITTGDTALRSARLIIADSLHIEQHTLKRRLLISLPLFLAVFLVMQLEFDILWRYFAWGNQTLSVFTLWAITLYLARRGRAYVVSLLPALFMTVVSISYILFAPEGFAFSYSVSVGGAILCALALLIWFGVYYCKEIRKPLKK